MTGLQRNFKATKFAGKMCGRGKDCIALEIEGLGKQIIRGIETTFDWAKKTVYMRVHDRLGNVSFLEYAETSTGTWFKVTNKDTIRRIQNEFAFQRNC